ncbi:MAG: HlyC/CorC family transporter [Phycisphaerae bacterium]|nr:HlyC/CorC family transporter [Phycisphaerae bacterium]
MEFGPAEIALASLVPPLIIASAFFSSSETALFGLSAADRAALRKTAPATARAVDGLLSDERQLLITILLSNMTVNTVYFVICSVVLAKASFGPLASVLYGAATLLIVVLGGEVVPKLLADSLRLRATQLIAPPLALVHRAIRPIRRSLDRLVVAPLSRLTSPGEAPPRLSAEELEALLAQSGVAGVIDADEQRILRGVFALRSLRVRDVMTPRVDMAWIDASATRGEVAELAATRRLTRLPVMGKGIDDVVGFLQVKRYLLDTRGAAAPLLDHVRTPRFVPDLATAEQLLESCRASRSDLAIVVDEYGGTAGVVAMEDCVEEVVGDIVSPEEVPEAPPTQVAAGAWIVAGDMNLKRWADAFGSELATTSASTLGGLVLERLGRPAVKGDVVTLANLRLEVEDVVGMRVRRVRVRLEEDRGGEGEAS